MDYVIILNKNHARRQRKECWPISDPDCLDYLSTGQEWPGLRSVVKVVGRREAETGITVQPRYFISSPQVEMPRQYNRWLRSGPVMSRKE